MLGTCPTSHPFVLDDGKSCCSSFKRTLDSSNPTCDGGDLQSTDPVECCPNADTTSCNSVYGCNDNNAADGKNLTIYNK